MPGRLSADHSHLGKWILPPVWLTLWGYFTWLMFTDPAAITWEGALQPPRATKWVFLGVGVLGVWLMARYLLPLQRVDLRGESLIVAAWRRERLVPLSEVRGVRWRFRPSRDRAGLVEVEHRSGGSPGRILFVPKSEAIVEELRALVTRETGLRPED